MRTLSATLIEAQRSASTEPYLRVRLYDRDVGAIRLRWQRIYTGTEPDGPCAAALPADGSLLRARIDPATGAVTRQRVVNPGPTSDFTSWTSVATAAVGPRVGQAAGGTRALIAFVHSDGLSVEVRESSDSGATYPLSTVLAIAPATVTAVACALASDGSGAVLYAAAGVVYSVVRTGPGSWGPSTAWSQSLASVSGLAAFFEVDFNVLVSGTVAAGDAGVWSTVLGVGGGVPPGTWLSLGELIAAAPGTSTTYVASGTMRADAPQAAFAESYAGGGAYDRVYLGAGVARTVYLNKRWRDPRPFEHESPYGLGAAAALSDAWLVAPHGVWHAQLDGTAVELADDVLEAELRQERRRGGMRLVLRNDDGRYDAGAAPIALAAGGELQVEPGYVTSAGAESSAGPGFWIQTLRRRHQDGRAVVEIEAVDGWGLLDAWTAPRQLVWSAGQQNAAAVLGGVMQRPGLLLGSTGASLESITLQPAFTVRAGERGSGAVRRLLRALPDEVVMQSQTPVLTEPAASDPVDDAFGVEHAILGLAVEAGRPAAGWARAFGSGVLAQAVDEAALADGGGALIVVDENLSAQARADVRADAVLRQSRLAVERGELRVRPHAGLEVGDVVTVTAPEAGLSAAPFRVAGLRLRYARGGPRPVYEQRVMLSEV